MSQTFEGTFLAFMHNTYTGEEFIAPALGQTREEAEQNLRTEYPSAVYSLKTMYGAADVEAYLNDLRRWPGLPSKTQPPLADLLSTARLRAKMGGLPPLTPRQQGGKQPASAQPAADNGRLNREQLEQIRTIAQGLSPQTQDIAKRLIAQELGQEFSARIEQSASRAPQGPQPAMPTQVTDKITAKATDLKTALAALRGETVKPAATSIQPQPRAATGQGLPQSARGVAAAPAAERALPGQMVGKVSAISVLKALRQRG